ncbi:hypothetical protein GOBAR_DD18933 [Gossypium barbadense]|nr:hypothetical protein GOBAR_DD18933 [Gossypium barbadense]
MWDSLGGCRTWGVHALEVTATWDNGGVDLLLTVSVSAVCFLGVRGLGLGPSVLGQGGRASEDVGQFGRLPNVGRARTGGYCDVGQWWRRSAADC